MAGDGVVRADLWQVLVKGSIERWSLDALDTAFARGFIDEETLVRPPGPGQEWASLGDLLAGVEDSGPSTRATLVDGVVRAAPPRPRVDRGGRSDRVDRVSEPPPSVAAVTTDLDALARHAHEIEALGAPSRPRRRARAVAVVAAVVLAALSVAGAATAWLAPEVARDALATCQEAFARDDDVDAPPAAASTSTRPSRPTTRVEVSRPEPAPAPAPVARVTQAAQAEPTRPLLRLTDDQRRALLKVDEARAARPKLVDRPRAKKRSKGKRGPGTTLFRAGGDAHDPLNASLE